MCYLLREPSVQAEPGRVEPPPKVALPRQRWLVAGAALAGSIAMAALVSPAGTPETAPSASAPISVTATAAAEPTGGSLQRTALPADDDVPVANGGTPARLGHCHEGM